MRSVFLILLITLLSQFSWATNLWPLKCELYDLALAQVLEQKSLTLYEDKESVLNFDAYGVSCQIYDSPVQGNQREMTLIIESLHGVNDKRTFVYNRSELSANPRPPYVISELPGIGDTVFLYCR